MEFLQQDETPTHLVESLAALQKIKGIVDDRARRINKELAVMLRHLCDYEKKQQKSSGLTLKKGAGFFEKLCKFDTATIKQALSEEIGALESAIKEARA